MSLIGPRPLLVKYLPYYNNEEVILYNNERSGTDRWQNVHIM